MSSPIDQLFALPPGEFTAARNALAKQLKAAGQLAEAREVAALRKPTQLVHAVNQLARSHARELAAVLAAGKQLHAAHEQALAGSGGGGLHEAVRAMRDATAPLVDAAEANLGREGAPLRHRVAEMIRAAATGSERERDLLARGRFEVEPSPEASFGDPDVVRVAAPHEATAKPHPAKPQPPHPQPHKDELAEARKAAAAKAAAERAEKAQAAEEAREAARARKALDDARAESERAEARLVVAQREAEAARARVREAEAVLRKR